MDTPKSFENNLNETLWSAYTDSLSYEFHGSCYTGSHGVCRDVTVTHLDIPALIADLQPRVNTLLATRARNEGIFGEYTDDFIMETLASEAADMAADQGYLTTSTITLQLVGQLGQWHIRTSPQLTQLLQGSMGGA